MDNQNNTYGFNKINWNFSGENEIKRKFVIPVGKITKKDAEKSLMELISNYKEEIIFDDENLLTNLEIELYSILNKYVGKTLNDDIVKDIIKDIEKKLKENNL